MYVKHWLLVCYLIVFSGLYLAQDSIWFNFLQKELDFLATKNLKTDTAFTIKNYYPNDSLKCEISFIRIGNETIRFRMQTYFLDKKKHQSIRGKVLKQDQSFIVRYSIKAINQKGKRMYKDRVYKVLYSE